MSENTKIEWCDHSWSPWRGCTKVSAGCANCYAETLSKRNPSVLGQWGKGKPRVLAKNWADPVKWNARADNELDARLAMGKGNPPHEKTSYTVFPSLCDWLDDEVPVEWLARFLELIHATPNLTWLLLTKRPENWRRRLNDVAMYPNPGTSLFGEWEAWFPVREIACNWVVHGIAPANVWIGTSVEDQANADRRIPELLKIPAVGRFLSLEPLLGPVDLSLHGLWKHTCEKEARNYIVHADDGKSHPEICRDKCDQWMEERTRAQNVDWLIIGGESGPGARPCNVEWIRSLVAQGKAAGVETFVKQLGADPIDRNDRGFEGDSGPSGWPMDTDTTDDFTGGVYQGKPVRVLLNHPKGGDPAEWPNDLRVREFPEGLR